MADLKKGDKIRVGELETVVEYVVYAELDVTNLGSQIMVGTPYGEFNIDLVEKIEEDNITIENGLTYAEDYKAVDLNHFVGIVPIRELESNEELNGICQIKDERTGIMYVGFVVKVWDTASLSTEIWIGSKLAKNDVEKE